MSKQRGKVYNLTDSHFTPLPERVLITSVCRDVYGSNSNGNSPSVLTPNGFQDGFGEYTTHLPAEEKFSTNQKCYGLSFLEANVEGPTYLQYPYYRDILTCLASGNYDVLCISAYTWSLPWAKELAERAKKDYGVREVWLGGYAVMTDDPEMNQYFDRLFWGYSESNLNQAIGKGEIELDEIKHPDLITKAFFLGRKSNVGHILFQRGCPNQCSYCADPVFQAGGEKPLSIRQIEAILDYYKENGIHSIYISNQNTDLFSKKGSMVLDALWERSMSLGMLTSFRTLNTLGHDGIKKLHEKGLKFLLLGLESLNDVNLIKTKRKAETNEMYGIMKLLQDLRIIVTTTYMICFEDDTPETIREAKKIMINELGVTVCLFNITMPLPSTPMYWEYKKRNLIYDWDWSHWTGNHLVWRHPTISKEQARELLEEMRAEVNSPRYNGNIQAILNSRQGSLM